MVTTKRIQELVRAEINKADPIGLISMGAPKDEYSPEVEEIVKNFNSLRDLKEVEALVYKTFVKMFDSRLAGSRKNYKALASRIFKTLNT